MNVNLNGVVADLVTPATKMIDQLILADKAAHATEQDFEKPDFAS